MTIVIPAWVMHVAGLALYAFAAFGALCAFLILLTFLHDWGWRL